jgi:hypothetical protein
MRLRLAPWAIIVAALLYPSRTPGDEPERAPSRAGQEAADTLSMSPAVACRSIDGYDDYEVLPGAALTSDEKLLVYYRPLHYTVKRKSGSYQIHLTQDGVIRRRGQKPVLRRKDKVLDAEYKSQEPPGPRYLRNSVSVKGLEPGEYELEIILHDQLAEGSSATQTLRFRVVPAALPKPDSDAASTADDPAPAKRAKTKARPKASKTAQTQG